MSLQSPTSRISLPHAGNLMDNQQIGRRSLWWMWIQRRRVAVVYAICLIIYLLLHQRQSRRRQVKCQIRTLYSERQRARDELMRQIIGSEKCHDIIRMGPKAFIDLCDILGKKGGLQPTQRAMVEEQVAKFLYILSHNVKNRPMSFFFRRYGETVSRHFHRVLRSIIRVHAYFLKQPDGLQTPPEILNSSRFYPYFKDCIGAIDGTHVRVKVPVEDAPRFRGRKDYPTQNVLAACTFDLKFVYVLAGWEGTASDSRILKSALSRSDNLKIPQGKYYLLDAGFMLKGTLITPYRGVRYHLKEYSRNPPRNAKELFNLRHASLRNVIERAFGVLKKRFPIIASTTEPTYGIETQKKIIIACCILHNYLMEVDPDDRLLAEVDEELLNNFNPHGDNCAQRDDEDAAPGELIRDLIANAMWRDYTSNPM